MAGKSKDLRTDIILGGKIDSSFYSLGTQLQTLGNSVNTVSKKLIAFGKESVNTYVSYEDAMLDAEVALKTQYNSASELNDVMTELNKNAMQWAAQSRFTTDDVASAISNAAHAGWDLEQITAGVPTAMNLALAGSMDLAEGLEYLIDISNAAGLSFEDLDELADYWTYAANSSSTTVEEMGAAMQRMGATMQFVNGDMAGLTTMLAVLANNGTKGESAGTLLRNSMIRLIAPTQKAAEAMDDLNLTADELEEIYADTDGLEEAVALLEEAGFSAYDSNGNLKNFLTIFEELQQATAGMNDQTRNDILAAIFPTRTITGALALLDAAANGWNGLYDSISGNASGYTEYARDTMESGLGGTLRQLSATWDVLKTLTGDALSDDVGWVAEQLTDLIAGINNMDEAAFNGMVSGLEVIAAAGPGLIAVGGAFKMIGALSSVGPFGWAILAATALTAAGRAWTEYTDAVFESNYEEQFGTMSANMETLTTHINSMGAAFNTSRTMTVGYTSALEAAVTGYEEAASSFSSELLTGYLTGELTETDIANLTTLGTSITDTLMDVIGNSFSAGESVLLGYSGESLEELADDTGLWGMIADTMNYGYETAIAQATQLSQDLRSAMTSAFADGVLTSEEIDDIQSIIAQQDELIAAQAYGRSQAEQERLLRKSQSLGLEGLEEIGTLVDTERQSEHDALEDDYYTALANLNTGGYMKIQNGVRKADGTLYTEEDLQAERDALYAGYQQKLAENDANYDDILLKAVENAVGGSDLVDTWETMGQAVDLFTGGLINENGLYGMYENGISSTDRAYAGKYLDTVMEMLGGEDSIRSRIDYYNGIGDSAHAEELSRLLYMNMLSDGQLGGGMITPALTAEEARGRVDTLSGVDSLTQMVLRELASGNGDAFMDYMTDYDLATSPFVGGLNSIMRGLSQTYDLSRVDTGHITGEAQPYAAAYKLMYDESINPEDYALTLPVDGDLTELDGRIDAMDGTSVTVNVDANTSAAQSDIDRLSQTVHVNVSTTGAGLGAWGSRLAGSMARFAEGGRATTASIFGEAGAEWAIPEEHSARTADLLNAAREASGFTWGELLSRNGGLNAGGTSSSNTLVYSPTIYANDSRDLESKLLEDKKRLEDYLKNIRMRNDAEVYA